MKLKKEERAQLSLEMVIVIAALVLLGAFIFSKLGENAKSVTDTLKEDTTGLLEKVRKLK